MECDECSVEDPCNPSSAVASEVGWTSYGALLNPLGCVKRNLKGRSVPLQATQGKNMDIEAGKTEEAGRVQQERVPEKCPLKCVGLALRVVFVRI